MPPCACDPVKIDAHHALRESTTHLARLDALTADRCAVRIVVDGATASGEHKFKVRGWPTQSGGRLGSEFGLCFGWAAGLACFGAAKAF